MFGYQYQPKFPYRCIHSNKHDID